jgi:hypothetical protein
VLAYALTIFIGAFLLFQVQPLIGKYILPWFGGGPGVWTTCMLFFQVMLLGGYAYAHFTSRQLKPRAQVIVHFLLLAAALAMLPVTPADSWKPDGRGNPTTQILLLLTATIGVPYFLLSTTGPLLQQWFARANPGVSPYRLYALSNLGSLLALVSYPFYFETHFTRKAQATLWAVGLGIYALGLALCAWGLWSWSGNAAGEASGESADQTNPQSDAAPWFHQLLWLLLPACASVLLLATTNKLCLDVAVIPFLWVVPLALYLLTFIIAFDSPRWYRRDIFTPALILALAGICWALAEGSNWTLRKQVTIYSSALFVCCLVCHGELYRLRPDPRQLTKFYLMIAAGGALGGGFVAIGAPRIFTDYYELHWGAFVCGLLFFLVWLVRRKETEPAPSRLAAKLRMCLHYFPALLALGVLVLGAQLWKEGRKSGTDTVSTSRNFYGVLTVYEHYTNQPAEHHFLLQHGRITHGLQFVDPERATWPTTYYGEQSGVGLGIKALPSAARRIGLVGLGAGTLTAYGRSGDTLRIYEINPEVERLATNRFTYLTHCPGKVEVALGDARLTLEREPPQHFDLLALDAFSSDAIPVHLLTREAFELYERHLNTNGILAVHISNHYLDLEPVVRNLAREFHYEVAAVDYDETDEEWWLYSTTWLLLSRDTAKLHAPPLRDYISPPPKKEKSVPLWTDDFASLFQILR